MLSEHIIHAMKAAAARSWPEEACGLLTGEYLQSGQLLISALHMSKNCAENRSEAFLIDPSLHIALRRRIRGSDSVIAGIFHSHPKGSAEPSSRDQASEAEEDWIWFILGREGQEMAGLKAFRRPGPGTKLLAVEFTAREQANAA